MVGCMRFVCAAERRSETQGRYQMSTAAQLWSYETLTGLGAERDDRGW